jgi:DNA-binding transcriptional ArsR family regulator
VTDLLCAVCADLPATHPDLIDGRPYMVCLSCRGDETSPPRTEPQAPPEPRLLLEDVVAVVAEMPGATSIEVAARLGLAGTHRQRHRVWAAISRLVGMGQVVRAGMSGRAPRYEAVPDAQPIQRKWPHAAPPSRLASLPPLSEVTSVALAPRPPRRRHHDRSDRPPEMKDRVLAAVRRSPGCELSQIAEGLGKTGLAEQNHVSVTLTRLVRAGLVRREGVRGSRFYYPVDVDHQAATAA